MYYPTVTGLVNPLMAQQGAAAQQQLFDYNALAAVMNPQAAAAYGIQSQGKCMFDDRKLKLNKNFFFSNLIKHFQSQPPLQQLSNTPPIQQDTA